MKLIKPVKAKITFRDKGWNRLKNQLKEKQSASAIGLFEDDKYSNGDFIAFIGAIQEFGTDKIPERSFIREWFDKNVNKFPKKIRGKLLSLYKGNITFDDMLKWLGELGQDGIRETIIKKNSPPNAPSTIAKKGFNDPLIDSGKMLVSIKHKEYKGTEVNRIK